MITIKQKQEIYEHLLTLDCPDLLAALIAERSACTLKEVQSNSYVKTLSDFIRFSFDWVSSEEGWGFWSEIYDEVDASLLKDLSTLTEKQLNEESDVNDVDISKVYTSPSISDFDAFLVEVERPQVTTWQKVKLWFGKFGYGV